MYKMEQHINQSRVGERVALRFLRGKGAAAEEEQTCSIAMFAW